MSAADGSALRSFWCEHALVGSDVVDGVVVGVSNGRIADVGRATTAPAGAITLRGVTLPGLANAHSHAFHRGLRGRTHGGAGTFWTWREQMFELAARLTPDNYERLATAVFAEMLCSGYTAVGEFHYVHHQRNNVPYTDRNEIGRRILRAAATAGIRLTLLDTLYLTAGLAGGDLTPVQRRFSDLNADRWLERVGGLTVDDPAMQLLGAAVHSVRAVPPQHAAAVAEWATAAQAPLHAHVSEQPAENVECEAQFGCSPTALFDRYGLVNERFTAIHATHTTVADATLLGRGKAACCFCPTTERDLADGIGPSGQLAAAGVRLCIGSDSHAVIDPFEEMRAVELDHRLATRLRGTHPPMGLLAAGGRDGYRSLGWDGGRLAVGAVADLVTVRLDSRRLAGIDDLAAGLVFAATSSDVGEVIVGGEFVVRDGEHRTIDVAAELAAAIDDVWAVKP